MESINMNNSKDGVYYFAYGSNIDPIVMLNRGIRYKKRELGILYGSRLQFNKLAKEDSNIGYASIIISRKEITEGALYFIDIKDLEKLDKYEGYPIHYNKYTAIIHTKTKRTVTAVIYVAQKEKTKKGLYPTKEYLSHLLAGKDLFSQPYYEKLKKTEAIE